MEKKEEKMKKEITKEQLEQALKDLELEGGLEISGNPRRVAKFLDAITDVSDAIEELLQYREIGSVDTIKKVIELLSLPDEDKGKITDTFDELFSYRKIGTVQECKHAVDEATEECPQIVELCPHCNHEISLNWDIETDGYQVFCPYCGKPVMLCSMCDARDGAPCDWEEGKGCKHSNSLYKKYFEKEWITTDQDLPDIGKPVWIHQTFGGCAPVTIGRRKPVPKGQQPYWEFLQWHKDFRPAETPSDYSIICPGNSFVKAWMPLPKEIEELIGESTTPDFVRSL